MSLRTAVVGGWTVSDNHLYGLAELPLTTLAAFCDIDSDRVRAVAGEYGITGYTDAETMFVPAMSSGPSSRSVRYMSATCARALAVP